MCVWAGGIASVAVTDIRLSVRFFDDIKVRRLQHIHGAEGVLGLQRLWVYTALNRPLGILDDIGDSDIPLITDVYANEFLETLLKLNFLMRDSDGVLRLVNWEKHQTWVIDAPKREEKARKAAKAKWDKAFQKEAAKQ